MMRKFFCLVLAVCLAALPALADDFGRSYRTFEALYAENIRFINDNTGRHLLPHSTTRDYDAQGKRIYRIESGALSMEIHLDDMAEQIASCRITLTAPANMKHGDSQHYDFTTAGYHSYALMMAMDDGATAYDRYALVTEVNAGLAASSAGLYETQVGDYVLKCDRANGIATLLFENQLLLSSLEPIVPDEESDEVPEEEEDAFLG